MNDFVMLAKIGEGAYSTVMKVKRLPDDKIYALKKVKLGQLKAKEKSNALNEIRILASIDDENIVGYKEAFFDDQLDLCIVMDLAENGDLQNKIKEHLTKKQFIKEEEVWKMLYNITQGLSLLHSMNILHRDIKCANVFISNNMNYQLGDMNVSIVAKKQMAYTQTGTPYYASPEVWRDEPYDTKSDIWSLGCVAFEMAALHPPFRAADMEQLYRKVQKGIYERIPNNFSQDLMTVISSCLTVNPKSRPSAAQLLDSMRKNTQQFNHSEQEGKNILLDTIKMPQNMNMRQLKGILPKAKYVTSETALVDRSFNSDNRGRGLLPIISSQFIPKSVSQLNESKHQSQMSKQLDDLNTISPKIKQKPILSYNRLNYYQDINQLDRKLNEKLLNRQRNLINIDPQILMGQADHGSYQPDYHRNQIISSSQIQNAYADRNDHRHPILRPQQQPKIIVQHPYWWG